MGADNVVITTGGMGGLASTFAAVLDPGDEVLVPDPGWPNYSMQISCCNGVPIAYDLCRESKCRPQTSKIESLITERTKAIVVNSPSNPTGAVIEEETAHEILDLARGKGILVVSDEVYEDIVYGRANPSFLREGALDNVACVYSFSKTWSMTGWRVGYVVTAADLAAQIGKLQEVYYACASSVSQHAALAALAMSEDETAGMLAVYRRRLDIVTEVFKKNNITFVEPEGAFYCLADIAPSGMGSDDFAVQLLEAEGVAVAPGNAFGRNSENMVRICFAVADEKLREGLERFARFLGKASG